MSHISPFTVGKRQPFKGEYFVEDHAGQLIADLHILHFNLPLIRVFWYVGQRAGSVDDIPGDIEQALAVVEDALYDWEPDAWPLSHSA